MEFVKMYEGLYLEKIEEIKQKDERIKELEWEKLTLDKLWTDKTKEIETLTQRLEKAEEVIRFYSDKDNWLNNIIWSEQGDNAKNYWSR